MRAVRAVSILMVALAAGNRPTAAQTVSPWLQLALGTGDSPRLIAYRAMDGAMVYGVRSSTGTWTCTDVRDAVPLPNGPLATGQDGIALVLGPSGEPWIAATVERTLTVACPDVIATTIRKGLWLFKGTTTVPTVPIDTTSLANYHCFGFPRNGDHVSMARGPDGRVHVLYLVENVGDPDGGSLVRYTVSNAAVTSFDPPTTLAPGVMSTPATATAIAVDAANKPHVVFSNPTGPVYGYYNGLGWNLEYLSLPGYSAGFDGIRNNGVALALGPSGLAHIALGLSEKMWYLRESSPLTFTDQTQLQRSIDDSGGPSIAVDASGTPYLSFWESGWAWYATRPDPAVWVEEAVGTVSSAYPSGNRTSLALTSGTSPQPRIAFESDASGAGTGVRFAARSAGGWTVVEPALPCYVPPPPPGDGGGDDGGNGDKIPGLIYQKPPEEGEERIGVRSPITLQGNASIELQVVTMKSTSLRLDVLDVAGRLADRGIVPLRSGDNSVKWGVGRLPAGVYLVRARIPDGLERTFRVVIVR